MDVVTGDLSADGKSNLSVRTSTFEDFGRRDMRFHPTELVRKTGALQDGSFFLPGFLGSVWSVLNDLTEGCLRIDDLL